MLSIKDFLIDQKKPEKTILSGFYDDVFFQALNHNTRSDYTKLFKVARPNEEDVYTTWRNDNKRRITADPIYRFKSMLVRTFKNSFDQITYENFDHFETLRYELLELSNIDPNAIYLDWPTNPNNPLAPLTAPIEEGGLMETQRVLLTGMTVMSSRIQDYVEREYLIFESNESVPINKERYPIFYSVDKNSYFKIIPFLNTEKKVVYETIEWYAHNLGMLPVVTLPGVRTFEESTKQYYKESYCFPAYELLDETIIAFSTDQVSRIRFLSPKQVVVGEIECPTCNGSGKNEKGGQCKTCNGNGHVTNFGDFSTIKIAPPSSNFDDTKVNVSNPIFYLQPAQGLEYSKKVWEDFLDRAERALCTDPLEGTGNESGVAKSLRLEPRQDLIESIGNDFYVMSYDLAFYRHKLLFIDDFEQVVMPTKFNSRSLDVLRIEITSSLRSERHSKYMEYVKASYKDDPLSVLIHKVAAIYAPLLLYTEDEAMSVLATGTYSTKDIIRRDHAVFALTEIITDVKTIDYKAIFAEADAFLENLGFFEVQANIFGGDTLDQDSDEPI